MPARQGLVGLAARREWRRRGGGLDRHTGEDAVCDGIEVGHERRREAVRAVLGVVHDAAAHILEGLADEGRAEVVVGSREQNHEADDGVADLERLLNPHAADGERGVASELELLPQCPEEVLPASFSGVVEQEEQRLEDDEGGSRSLCPFRTL